MSIGHFGREDVPSVRYIEFVTRLGAELSPLTVTLDRP